MTVEKVTEETVDLKKVLEDKAAEIDKLNEENLNLKERISALEEALNERDLTIYNLAIKISRL